MRPEVGFWTAACIARALPLKCSQEAATQYVRRLLRRLKIDRQDAPRGEVYVSESDLQTKLPSVWAKVKPGVH
jgi:hypothetical protein